MLIDSTFRASSHRDLVQVLGLEHTAGALMVERARGHRRQGEILMIVGAAGIVTGLLADEDVITIAGAGVGGFGLYQYLQATRCGHGAGQRYVTIEVLYALRYTGSHRWS